MLLMVMCTLRGFSYTFFYIPSIYFADRLSKDHSDDGTGIDEILIIVLLNEPTKNERERNKNSDWSRLAVESRPNVI